MFTGTRREHCDERGKHVAFAATRHDGARDTEDLAEAGLAFFISDLGQVPLRVLKGAGHGGGCEGRRRAGRKAQSLAMDERRQGRLTTVLQIRRAAAGPEPGAL